MTLGVSNIDVTFDVKESKNIEQYFPTVTTLGQPKVENIFLSSTYILTDPVTFFHVQYTLFSTNEAVLNNHNTVSNAYYLTTLDIPTYKYFVTNITFKDVKVNLASDVNSYFFVGLTNSWPSNLAVSFYNTGYMLNYKHDFLTDFKIYIGTVKYSRDLYSEAYFSKYKVYSYLVDVFSANELLLTSSIYDVYLGTGSIFAIHTDITNCTLGIQQSKYDVFSSELKICNTRLDVLNRQGKISSIDLEVLSSDLKVESLSTDIRLNSLYIFNFFPRYDDFRYFGDVIQVDIEDFIFDLNISEIYFELEGVRLSTTFNGNNRKVTVSCTIDTSFNFEGRTYIKVVATNMAGDIFYKNFPLLFGYSLELNVPTKFEYTKDIIVHSCATNAVSCPNTECNSFVFTTVDYPSYNLSASISCVLNENLAASIFPQSTAFFYGKRYDIKIANIKDYSGNVMSPVVLSFIIEEK